jgi:hypothetical protein
MSPRDKRALVAGAAVIVSAILVLRVVPALARRYMTLRHETMERLATVERARMTLASAGALRDSSTLAAGELVALAPKLLAGATAAEAAATLASDVSLIASRAGLRVLSLNAAPDSGAGAFVPVTLRAELEGDLSGLTELLRAVEGARILLTVNSMRIVAADPLQRQPGPEQLRIALAIEGWRLRSART